MTSVLVSWWLEGSRSGAGIQKVAFTGAFLRGDMPTLQGAVGDFSLSSGSVASS